MQALCSPMPRTLAALAAVIALAQPAAGQNSRENGFDTPALSPVDAGLFSVTLRVQAGATGAPGGFSIQWMKRSDYEAHGGWPSNSTDPRLVYCNFLDRPTLNLWGATSFQLGPDGTAYVQPGDLFDETGIVTNSAAALEPGVDYVARARALTGPGGSASEFTSTLPLSTLNGECTLGFWKNHPDLWPSACLPMSVGGVSYTKADLILIFGQSAKGNGLVSLAHQLIAAKLNLCNGSEATTVAGAIAAADALIGSLVVPPIGSGYLAPSSSSDVTEGLDDYNNGRLGGVAECPTPIRSATSWGRLKALYR